MATHKNLRVIIEGVTLPLVLNSTFTPTDIEGVVLYYPKFLEFAKNKWHFNSYLSYILNRIDEEIPNGYNGNSALSNFINKIGGGEKYIEKIFPYFSLYNLYKKES